MSSQRNLNILPHFAGEQTEHRVVKAIIQDQIAIEQWVEIQSQVI